MTVVKNWVKGGLLMIAVPCILTTAIVVGVGFHLLGVRVAEGKRRSDEQDSLH